MQRMENLTWRMMALGLKRRKEMERARLAAFEPMHRTGSGFPELRDDFDEVSSNQRPGSGPASSTDESHLDTRGRLPKTKLRVEGFGGSKDDDDSA